MRGCVGTTRYLVELLCRQSKGLFIDSTGYVPLTPVCMIRSNSEVHHDVKSSILFNIHTFIYVLYNRFINLCFKVSEINAHSTST